jgi:hypothetical protein
MHMAAAKIAEHRRSLELDLQKEDSVDYEDKVCVCVCVCMYTPMYTCVYVRTCVCVCLYVSTFVPFACMYAHACVFLYVPMYTIRAT